MSQQLTGDEFPLVQHGKALLCNFTYGSGLLIEDTSVTLTHAEAASHDLHACFSSPQSVLNDSCSRFDCIQACAFGFGHIKYGCADF